MNAARIPHWVGRPIDWWHANTPVASMVESDRRMSVGEPAECVALARTGLRVRATVLAHYAGRSWFAYVTRSASFYHIWPQHPYNTDLAAVSFPALVDELRVLPS